jgi:hypothetical protein
MNDGSLCKVTSDEAHAQLLGVFVFLVGFSLLANFLFKMTKSMSFLIFVVTRF